MTEIVTLKENSWLSLKELRAPEAGVAGYVFSHETRCQGRIVLVLPYRWNTEDQSLSYLVKSEVTPCWSMEPVRSGVTGGYEGEDIADDAVREMLEETGYSIQKEDLEYLGTCYASKSSDTVYTLYAVDVGDLFQAEALGDGTRLESESETIWVNLRELAAYQDAQLCTAALRLLAHVWHNKF